ncbi:hypothetical protein TL16_g01695 [Triparma laevis f. inornata]|uniref:Ubiquitin-like domain-containing protein n=1 Tax=Triparma laevis f. inornata TaxID=1714386 RepID=A0A9W7DTJ8_9STRA|nr:hypothetical protein TL16_g01695 [Triparma laevis f. inornata]
MDKAPDSDSGDCVFKSRLGRNCFVGVQAYNFEPENTVLQVKQSLQEKEGIQVDQIRLIYSGKQLADDRQLDTYNITAGGTVHMVLQLRGGM